MAIFREFAATSIVLYPTGCCDIYYINKGVLKEATTFVERTTKFPR